jgi:hypothetical protein
MPLIIKKDIKGGAGTQQIPATAYSTIKITILLNLIEKGLTYRPFSLWQ